MAPCSRASSVPSRLTSTSVGIELNLKCLLKGAGSVSARKQDGIVDSQLLDGFDRTGLAILRCRGFFTSDPDHLELFSSVFLLKLDQVRDRLPAGLAPASPEIQQDHVGVDVVKRDHLAAQVGKLEIDQPALGGIDTASALLDGLIERRLRAAQKPRKA